MPVRRHWSEQTLTFCKASRMRPRSRPRSTKPSQCTTSTSRRRAPKAARPRRRSPRRRPFGSDPSSRTQEPFLSVFSPLYGPFDGDESRKLEAMSNKSPRAYLPLRTALCIDRVICYFLSDGDQKVWGPWSEAPSGSKRSLLLDQLLADHSTGGNAVGRRWEEGIVGFRGDCLESRPIPPERMARIYHPGFLSRRFARIGLLFT